MVDKRPDLRLTVNETIYYQRPGEDATMFPTTFVLHPSVGEQIFTRESKVGTEKIRLICGWVEQAICIRLKNTQKTASDRNLSEEQKEELERHEILVTLGDAEDGFLLSPGESLRVRPTNLEKLMIRSLYGETPYEINVFSE